MRRASEIPLAMAGSGALAALALWPALSHPATRLAGAWASWGQAWGMARLRWELSGSPIPAVDGPVVLAGLPQRLSGAALSALVDLPVAFNLVTWLWLAAGVFAVWLAARGLGASRWGAAVAAILGGLNPALMQAAGQGWTEWLAAPLLALGLYGALAEGEDLRNGLLGGLGAGLTALCTPVLGVAAVAVSGLAALGRSPRRALTLVAAGALMAAPGLWPWRHGGALPRPNVQRLLASLDLADLLAPLWTWREWGVHPGLALWLGLGVALWMARGDRPARALLAALFLAVVLALGGELQWGGARLGASGVPLPGRLIERLIGPDAVFNWKIAILPGLVAAALAVSRLGQPRLLALFAAAALAEAAYNGPVDTVDGEVPIGVRQLAEEEGTVLQLPLEVGFPAPEGTNMRALYFQAFHKRPLVTGMAPTWVSPLYGDPLVVLAANAEIEQDLWAIPPAGPVMTLKSLGVRQILLDRREVSVGSLALLDRLLARACESPQRDLVGRLDIFTIPTTTDSSPLVPEAMRLTELRYLPAGWYSPQEYLSRWR